MAEKPAVAVPAQSRTRIRVFVDYWNFQLALNHAEAKAKKVHPDTIRFKIDWKHAGGWLAQQACVVLGTDPAQHSFEGAIIYASYNPKSPDGPGFHKWASTWLDRQPGVQVHCRERKPKALPKCPSCHEEIERCPKPACGKRIVATVEKGVDTLIATDMIRLAWEDAYEVAVLATSDSDLIPAVEFLGLKGRKVIQAGFPPKGVDLATKCWGSFDVGKLRRGIER